MADFLFILSRDGRILHVNPAVEERLGFAKAELVGQPVLEVHPPERREEAAAIVAAMLQGGRELCPIPLLTKSGNFIPVETKVRRAKLNDEEVLLGISRDISERFKAEQALRESRRKYKAIFDQSPIAIEFFDSGGELIDINQACLDIFGVLNPEELRGFRLFEDPNISEPVKALLRAGKPARYESEFNFDAVHERKLYATPKQGLMSLDLQLMPLMENNSILGYVAQVQDITVCKHAERSLHETVERLQLILEGTKDGAWDWDLTTGAVVFDERWASMLGYRIDEIGKHVSAWEVRIHPEDKAEAMRILNDHLEGRIPYYESEHRMMTKEGTWKWILDRGKVVQRDADGKPLRAAGTHSDIAKRKEQEAERERLLLELKEAAAKIKTLSGLLPICAGCKKIRDDHGSWNPVEIYVQRHSEAQFTHGLCPECVDKYFAGAQ
jgi:PAS domain S-box-containing protein